MSFFKNRVAVLEIHPNDHHQVSLNDEFPSLDCRESMSRIITIYQPIFDAHDHELMSLTTRGLIQMALNDIDPSIYPSPFA